jgi:hypothetical protein
VHLIATAHGNTLENLLVNPTLSDLVGGIQTVTLGDEEARRRRTQKTILERKAPPTFDVLVEIQSWNKVAVHADVAKTVDTVLRGHPVSPEIREVDELGLVRKSIAPPSAATEFETSFDITPSPRRYPRSSGPAMPMPPEPGPRSVAAVMEEVQEAAADEVARPTKKVHPFGVSRERIVQAAEESGLKVALADNIAEADFVLTTKAHYRRRPGVLVTAEERGIPIYVLRKNSPGQIAGFLFQIAETPNGRNANNVDVGTAEAEEGVDRILSGGADWVELQPQSSFVRRVQHQIAEQAKLRSYSVGREPKRRVTIRKTGRS